MAKVWFDGVFNGGWELEELALAGAKGIFRGSVDEKTEVGGAKILRFAHIEQALVLILRQHQINRDEIEIVLRLYPASESIYLPEGIKLALLDDRNQPIPRLEKEAQANNWLQLRFKGNLGDRFSLKVSLAENSVTENFVI